MYVCMYACMYSCMLMYVCMHVGYLLSNGACGVDFNDFTKVLVGENGGSFLYIDQKSSRHMYSLEPEEVGTYIYIYMYVWIYAYTYTYIHTCIHTHIMHTYMHTYIHTYIHNMRTFLGKVQLESFNLFDTCILHTCIHACMHARSLWIYSIHSYYTHVYMHACMHARIFPLELPFYIAKESASSSSLS